MPNPFAAADYIESLGANYGETFVATAIENIERDGTRIACVTFHGDDNVEWVAEVWEEHREDGTPYLYGEW